MTPPSSTGWLASRPRSGPPRLDGPSAGVAALRPAGRSSLARARSGGPPSPGSGTAGAPSRTGRERGSGARGLRERRDSRPGSFAGGAPDRGARRQAWGASAGGAGPHGDRRGRAAVQAWRSRGRPRSGLAGRRVRADLTASRREIATLSDLEAFERARFWRPRFERGGRLNLVGGAADRQRRGGSRGASPRHADLVESLRVPRPRSASRLERSIRSRSLTTSGRSSDSSRSAWTRSASSRSPGDRRWRERLAEYALAEADVRLQVARQYPDLRARARLHLGPGRPPLDAGARASQPVRVPQPRRDHPGGGGPSRGRRTGCRGAGRTAGGGGRGG